MNKIKEPKTPIQLTAAISYVLSKRLKISKTTPVKKNGHGKFLAKRFICFITLLLQLLDAAFILLFTYIIPHNILCVNSFSEFSVILMQKISLVLSYHVRYAFTTNYRSSRSLRTGVLFWCSALSSLAAVNF